MAAQATQQHPCDLPPQVYAFHKYGKQPVVSEDGAQSEGDDSEDGQLDLHGNRWDCGMLLKLMRLQSLLKPSSGLKEAVVLVGDGFVD